MPEVLSYIDPVAGLFRVLDSYATLSREQQEQCRRIFRPRGFAKKQSLLNVGETWGEVYFITHGAVRLFYTSGDGREFNKGFFFERQFAWPIAPVARHDPSRFTIAAMQDTQVLASDFQVFKSMLQRFACWEQFALSQVEWLAEQKVVREAEFLLDPAEQRYLNFMTEYAAYVDRIPDYHIASYLGITHVSLSRIRKKLRAC